MSKRRGGVHGCLVVLLIVGIVVIVSLVLSRNWLQEKSGVHEEQSIVDEVVPQVQAVRQYRRAKRGLQVAEMKNIKDAFIPYQLEYSRPPETLESMVQSGQISGRALNDLWGQPYVYLVDQRNAFLLSGGPDRVRNTQDDICISLSGTELELSKEETRAVQSLLIGKILTTEAGSS